MNSHGGADVVLSGGRIQWSVHMRGDTDFQIHGNDFRFNGMSLEGQEDTINNLELDAPTPFLLTGTLTDGTPFAFHSNDYDTFELGTLSLVKTPTPAIEPGTIALPDAAAPAGIRTGQTVLVQKGGHLGDSFSAGPGSAIEIDGGAVGNDLEAIGAKVHLVSGQIGERFDALDGAEVIVEVGNIGNQFYAAWGSEVTLNGGSIGQFLASNGSRIKIHGGSIRSIGATTGAQVEIDGGGGYADLFPLSAASNTFVHLVGSNFLLDGVPIAGLVSPGDSLVMPNRNGELLAVRLRDGSTAQFRLRPGTRGQSGNFALDSTLRLTLVVPEPSKILPIVMSFLPAALRPRRMRHVRE
jgi:hypothetical protein